MQLIDLSHTIIHSMQVYPTDAPPELTQTNYIKTDGFSNFRLTLSMHTGTHIDGPMHMIDKPCLIADVSPENFTGKACIIDISGEEIFDDVSLLQEKSKNCSIVLFHTGHGRLFGTPQYLENYPVLSNEVAMELVRSQIKLVGVDTLSPDKAPYLVHKTLLSNGILIAENLANLHLLLHQKDFEIIALPLKIAADSAPARILAVLK